MRARSGKSFPCKEKPEKEEDEDDDDDDDEEEEVKEDGTWMIQHMPQSLLLLLF